MAERLAQVNGFPVPGGPPLDLDVTKGEVVRIVGPNGSGKTSLLRALAGLESWLQPASVNAERCGFAMQTATDSLVGLTVDGEFRLRDRPTPDELAQLLDRDVATLSAGEARRIAVAVATHQGPLLLLDEPSEGLDSQARHHLHDTIANYRDQGAVIVADHGDHWSDLADRTIHLGGHDDEAFPAFHVPANDMRFRSDGDHRTVGDRSIQIPPMDLSAGFHALVGPNGSGKTQALLHLLDDEGLPGVRMLPARAQDLLGHGTVQDELASADRFVVEALVPRSIMDRHPWSLSGGEQQRVAIAKVLGTAAPMFLLDEPEAHLDASGRLALHHVLQERINECACVLAATHDAGLIAAARTVVQVGGPA